MTVWHKTTSLDNTTTSYSSELCLGMYYESRVVELEIACMPVMFYEHRLHLMFASVCAPWGSLLYILQVTVHKIWWLKWVKLLVILDCCAFIFIASLLTSFTKNNFPENHGDQPTTENNNFCYVQAMDEIKTVLKTAWSQLNHIIGQISPCGGIF